MNGELTAGLVPTTLAQLEQVLEVETLAAHKAAAALAHATRENETALQRLRNVQKAIDAKVIEMQNAAPDKSYWNRGGQPKAEAPKQLSSQPPSAPPKHWDRVAEGAVSSALGLNV